ncbi:hypothetical protein [Psychrobacter sp. I-STPA10]|uniref:hypothetical protein n=1 Tax=Psychrobacter sp. I-STPA10 TaxID=2585769 RepID=UPI001E3E428C|nr:hypothetical protein [Psychrobacter sp. I-STPA10]
MADASQNNPKKELVFALVGLLAFLGIVLLIAISGYLRPAQEHVTVETATEDAVTVEGEQVGTVVSDPEQAELNDSVAEQNEVVAAADEEAAQAGQDQSAADESNAATVTAQAGTATATATVASSSSPSPEATTTDDTDATETTDSVQ